MKTPIWYVLGLWILWMLTVHPIPAQTKKHAIKDCTEFPLGDRPSDIRPMGDCPASCEILDTANYLHGG